MESAKPRGSGFAGEMGSGGVAGVVEGAVAPRSAAPSAMQRATSDRGCSTAMRVGRCRLVFPHLAFHHPPPRVHPTLFVRQESYMKAKLKLKES